MVERLSEEERESIKKNWSSIKSCGNETKEIKIDDYLLVLLKWIKILDYLLIRKEIKKSQ